MGCSDSCVCPMVASRGATAETDSNALALLACVRAGKPVTVVRRSAGGSGSGMNPQLSGLVVLSAISDCLATAVGASARPEVLPMWSGALSGRGTAAHLASSIAETGCRAASLKSSCCSAAPSAAPFTARSGGADTVRAGPEEDACFFLLRNSWSRRRPSFLFLSRSESGSAAGIRLREGQRCLRHPCSRISSAEF